MRHLDTIFKGICVLIIILSSYMKREKLVNMFQSSPIACGISIGVGALVMLVIFGIVTASVISM